MPFRFRKQARDPRRAEWERFAAEFELEPAPELDELLRHRFDLGDDALDPLYALSRPGQPQLIAFDQRRERSGPTGSVTLLRTAVALRAEADHTALSLRATPRRNKALEAIEASRSGARRFELPDDPGFDGSVSVYVRDTEAARELLTAPVRDVLRRLLLAADEATTSVSATGAGLGHVNTVAPAVVVGTRNLFLSLEPRQAFPLRVLGELLAEMLSLYAALDAARRQVP